MQQIRLFMPLTGMRTTFLLIMLLSPVLLNAQNLVVNGGFERQTPLTAGIWVTPPDPCRFSRSANILNTSALGWRTFDIETPDLLLEDSTGVCTVFPRPRKGERMVGLILYLPASDLQGTMDYHEFIQGTLARPLEKGKTYNISFWVYNNDSLGIQHLNTIYGKTTNIRPVFCGNFGFYFSDGKILSGENFMQSQLDFPVKPQIVYPDIVNTKAEWQKINLQFTADKPYKYFLFGNFSFDGGTPVNISPEENQAIDERNRKLDFWHRTKRIAYYLFDDFAVAEDLGTDIEKSLLTENRYTIPAALLFDTGKYDLKSEAGPALEALAAVLCKNPALRIEIGGYTDNVGDDKSNQTLSQKRAKAVFEALQSKTVGSERMECKGYGESSPVASNDTDIGRQKNRRVEFRVLK